MDELKAQIKERLESCPCKNPGELFGVLAEEGARVLPGCDNCEKVIETILSIYDEVIAPIDLPGVPNFLEPKVDALIRQALDILLHKIADSLHGS